MLIARGVYRDLKETEEARNSLWQRAVRRGQNDLSRYFAAEALLEGVDKGSLSRMSKKRKGQYREAEDVIWSASRKTCTLLSAGVCRFGGSCPFSHARHDCQAVEPMHA